MAIRNYANYDPVSHLLQDPLTRLLGAVPKPPPELPDESLLAEVAGGAGSALSYIGRTLDKTFGGATIRSILADGFDLADLAHLIPFSDTLGITDPNTVPTGRDLLENAGILDANTEGLDWGDVAGFGAEVVLDPSTWLGNWIGKVVGTTLTPAGKIAKTVGALPAAEYTADALKALKVGPRQQLLTKTLGDVLATPELTTAASSAAEVSGNTLADLLGQKLGGNFFGQSQGDLAQKIAGGFDAAGDYLSRTAPVRHFSNLFDSSVRDATAAPQQIAMRELTKDIDAAKSGMRGKLYEDVSVLDEAGLMKEKPEWLDDVFEDRGAVPPEFRGPPVATEPKPFSLASDPNELAGKQWYHGTGATNLMASGIDPTMTKADNLFGHGLYLTDNPQIAKGYAKVRGKGKTDTVYRAEINPSSVLNLEEAASKHTEVLSAIDTRLRQDALFSGEGVADEIQDFLRTNPNATLESVWRKLTEETSNLSHQSMIPDYEFSETFLGITDDLQKLGYDGFTHTGGKRTGKAPHQVLVMFDPSATAQIRPASMKSMTPLAMEAVDEIGRPLGRTEQAIANIKQELADVRQEGLSIGLDIGEGGGTYQGAKFGYRPRQMTELEAKRSGQYAYERSPNSRGRDAWADLPTSVINQISLDPVVAGAERAAKNNADAAEHLLANYLDPDATASGLRAAQTSVRQFKAQLKKEPGLYETLGPAIEAGQKRVEEIKAIRKNADAIADRIRERPADLVKAKLPIFPNHPVQDALDALVSEKVQIASHKKIFEGLQESAVRTGAATGGAGLVPIKDALRQTKLPTNVARANMAKALGVAPKELKNISVPKNVVEQMTRIIESFKSPQSFNVWANGIRKFTNTFKLGVTAWPDFQVRNLYSGQAMNWFGGYSSLSSVKNIENLVRDGKHVIPGLAGKGFFKSAKTDAEATEMLRKAWFSTKLTSYRQGMAGDVPGAFHETSEILAQIPGRFPAKSIFNPKRLYEAIPKSLDQAKPWKSRGISDVPATTFAPAKVGEDVGFYVESLNRGVPFLEALKKGHTPIEAKHIADALQVDYSKATRFESQKVKQLIPFYGWIKGIVPTLVNQLYQKPGGRMAQTIRAYNDLREDDTGFVPEHIGGGVAVGLGETKPGFQRYLTQIGLPFETLNSLIKPGASPLDMAKKTGLGLLGQTNPLIKGPLELMTGKQFFQDRDLADAYSPSGYALGDQIAYNSPLSKLYSRYHLAKSVVKGERELLPSLLQSTTGLRLSEIDVDKERDRAAMQSIKDELVGAGAKTFSSMYIPKDSLALMTEDQRKLAALYSGLQRRARKRSKLEKQQALTPEQ